LTVLAASVKAQLIDGPPPPKKNQLHWLTEKAGKT
jgi:hypothetical protein